MDIPANTTGTALKSKFKTTKTVLGVLTLCGPQKSTHLLLSPLTVKGQRSHGEPATNFLHLPLQDFKHIQYCKYDDIQKPVDQIQLGLCNITEGIVHAT